MVAVLVDTDIAEGWTALTGIRAGNNVVAASIAGVNQIDAHTEFNIGFNDDGSAVAVLTSCINGILFVCKRPIGTAFLMTKVF